MNETMSTFETLLPFIKVQWSPVHHLHHCLKHALVLRVNEYVKEIVRDALKDRRTKMLPRRLLGSPVVVWLDNPGWRPHDNVETVEDLSVAFRDAISDEGLSWKLMIQWNKGLAILVCDSLLFQTFADAAKLPCNPSKLTTILPRSAGFNGTARRQQSMHIFIQDPQNILNIATACGTSVRTVLVAVVSRCLSSKESSFSGLLFDGQLIDLSALPRDPVARVRKCSLKLKQELSQTPTQAGRVAKMSLINASSPSEVLCHMTANNEQIYLSIDAVMSRTEGLIVSVGSHSMTGKELERFENDFVSQLTDLSMALKVPWPDQDLSTDPKLEDLFHGVCSTMNLALNKATESSSKLDVSSLWLQTHDTQPVFR